LQEITVPVGAVVGSAVLLGRAATRVVNPMNWGHKPEIERLEKIDAKAQRSVKRSVEHLEDKMTKAVKSEKRGLGLPSKKLIKNKPIILEEQGLNKKIGSFDDRDVYVRGTLQGQHNLEGRTGLSSRELESAATDGFKAFNQNRQQISDRLGIRPSAIHNKEELMHLQSAYLMSQVNNDAPRDHIMKDAALFGISEKNLSAYARGIKIDFKSDDVPKPAF
jgi:hypothetical protein